MRSTIRRTASADSMVSGEASRRAGTKDRTIMSVSLSRNTSFRNSSGVRHARWLRGPDRSFRAQPPFWANVNADSGALVNQALVGSTKWPCTSKMNSVFSRLACATCGSCAASARRSKNPPVFPVAALAMLNASSVLAAPHADIRNSRRSRPERLALAVAASRAR